MENQIRTFGRIRGKKLSARQQWLVDYLLPAISPITYHISRDCEAILEIGFGAGEHILQLARENPDSLIIGAEPFINGVASLLSAMTNEQNEIEPEYKNIRIWPDDARKLFPFSSSFSLNKNFAKIFILHPDPWPKARHEKRRLLNAKFLASLAEMLARDGKIIIGTDHTDYFNWVLEQIKKTSLCLLPPAPCPIETRYQRKNIFGGAATHYLALTKQ